MLASHTHVGRSIKEIQNQKEELQLFQDTAKVRVDFESLIRQQQRRTREREVKFSDFSSPCRAHSTTAISF